MTGSAVKRDEGKKGRRAGLQYWPENWDLPRYLGRREIDHLPGQRVCVPATGKTLRPWGMDAVLFKASDDSW